MQSDANRTLQCRYRAEELRSISASWQEIDARDMLERIACDYECMASGPEQRTEAGEESHAIFGSGGDTRQ